MAYQQLDRRPSTSGSRRNTARQLMQSSAAPLSDGRQSSAITLPPSASTGLARSGGVDVNSYTGSMFAAPGTYTAARPTGLTPTRSGAPGHGGADVRSYSGSRYGNSAKGNSAVPIDEYQPQETSEHGADGVLRSRYGAPPNERGTVDVARTGLSRSTPTGPGQISIAGKPVTQSTTPSAMIGDRSYAATASPSGVPTDPAAIRTQMTPPLPTTQPAAIQPALDTPGKPVASPSTSAAPQTESNNPLTGAGNAQPGGTTDAINPAQAMGFGQRGTGTPKGSDALPADSNMGGTGLYARRFANPRSAKIYDSYVRKIFGADGQ